MAKKTANESSASAISRWENEGGALAKSLKDAREIVTKLQKNGHSRRQRQLTRNSRARKSRNAELRRG